MTNSPEATPDSSRDATTTDAAPSRAPPHTPELADATTSMTGTYDRLIEPRSENRLVLEGGVWHQISRKYVWVQLISTGSFLAIVVAATLVLALGLHQMWAWIPGVILTVIMGVDARDPAPAGARHRLPAARGRPRLPSRHPLAAPRRGAVRPHAARSTSPTVRWTADSASRS